MSSNLLSQIFRHFALPLMRDVRYHLEQTMSDNAPQLFVSYSHDSQEHRDWVLRLCDRLVRNGVNVVLDQWDLRLGGDLPRFMASGLAESDRVLAVCTEKYVERANLGKGGVGYETMILTAQLMRNVSSRKIIPLVRRNDLNDPTPTFLSSKLYVDFRQEFEYESRYRELIFEIHGETIRARPPLGQNPLEGVDATEYEKSISFASERYSSPALEGTISFEYSNNNGRFTVGSGRLAFETAWSGGSNSSIHAYSDPSNISTIALATGVETIYDIEDALKFDVSSRTRTPRIGEIVVWRNGEGFFAATQLEKVDSRSHGKKSDEVTFKYTIQPDRTASFKNLRKDA